MPIYVYKTDSGRIFEKFQHMSDEPLHQCPETGEMCHRVITGGHGALLPAEKNIKYRDGNFINSKMAKALEKSPFYTTLDDKRKKIESQSEKAREHNAQLKRKITGRLTEI